MSSCNGVVLQPHPCRNMDGLGCSPFARHYWGNHCLFFKMARGKYLSSSDGFLAQVFCNFFTILFDVFFTFPSGYWFAIGLSGVFSLTGWSRQIHARFLVSRATQDTTRVQLA